MVVHVVTIIVEIVVVDKFLQNFVICLLLLVYESGLFLHVLCVLVPMQACDNHENEKFCAASVSVWAQVYHLLCIILLASFPGSHAREREH